jgi:hypothetical protein
MNSRFIEKNWMPLRYELKEGTKGSFYHAGGQRGIMPNRISLGIFAQRKPSERDNQKKNELNAKYKVSETGLYYDMNKRQIHSSIWESQDFPEFYGYGIIDERYQIFDLVILYSDNQLASSVEIHIFKGMGKPEYFHTAFQFLREQKQKSPFTGA